MEKQNEPQQPWEGSSYLRLKSVIAPGGPIPISKSALYLWIRQGRFPAPISLGPRTSVWSARSVAEYLEQAEKDSGRTVEGIDNG